MTLFLHKLMQLRPLEARWLGCGRARCRPRAGVPGVQGYP